MFRKTLIFVFVLWTAAILPAAFQKDSLPRRGFLGVLTYPLSQEGRKWAGYFGPGGIAVGKVFEPSPAEDAGIQEGDVILKVNGQQIERPQQFTAAISSLKDGAKVNLTTIRGGKASDKTISLEEMPKETSKDYDIIYDTVRAHGNTLRVLITKPKNGGKMPALLFIQGNTCGSMEFLLDEPHNSRPLITRVAKNGFVTMRVEKSGVGDSEGKPCSQIDFNTEVEEFKAALKHLKAYDFVDKGKVFIFGHSMGGIIAPVIAADEPVKGIISYGSGYRPFFEYVLDIVRSQAELAGESQAEIANEVKFSLKLWGEYLGEKKSPQEILKTATGEYKKFVEASFPGGQAYGRHYTFFQNLYDLNLPEAWGKVNADVLAMWGKSDFISREIDHKMLVENMNKKRAGSATLVELENTDHLFFLVKDFKESFDIINKLSLLPPGFEPTSNPKYLDVVLDWLKKESK